MIGRIGVLYVHQIETNLYGNPYPDHFLEMSQDGTPLAYGVCHVFCNITNQAIVMA